MFERKNKSKQLKRSKTPGKAEGKMEWKRKREKRKWPPNPSWIYQSLTTSLIPGFRRQNKTLMKIYLVPKYNEIQIKPRFFFIPTFLFLTFLHSFYFFLSFLHSFCYLNVFYHLCFLFSLLIPVFIENSRKQRSIIIFLFWLVP